MPLAYSKRGQGYDAEPALGISSGVWGFMEKVESLASDGTCAAEDAEVVALLPLAYERLRAIAAGQRRRLPVHTLQTTALVNEAWLRLADSKSADTDRERFFGLFARVVRNVLIDHIRMRKALKRDAPMTTLSAVEQLVIEPRDMDRLLAIDAALTDMSQAHQRLVQVVELRYFAGYENQEIAEILGVNEKTVRRDWLMARAMLAKWLQDA